MSQKTALIILLGWGLLGGIAVASTDMSPYLFCLGLTLYLLWVAVYVSGLYKSCPGIFRGYIPCFLDDMTMNIDAVIKDVIYNPDGTATLYLQGTGQSTLVVLDPPAHLDASIGVRIRGGNKHIMVGERVWARRLGHTRIRLVAKATFPKTGTVPV